MERDDSLRILILFGFCVELGMLSLFACTSGVELTVAVVCRSSSSWFYHLLATVSPWLFAKISAGRLSAVVLLCLSVCYCPQNGN